MKRLELEGFKKQLSEGEGSEKKTEQNPELSPQEQIDAKVKEFTDFWNGIKGGKSDR